MYKKVKFHVTGIVPLIMHNGRMRDPLHKYAKALRELTSKRKKSDEDHYEIARLEWEAGLYWSKDLGPHIPARPAWKLAVEGARKHKEGKTAMAHMVSAGPARLIYDGPRDPDELWETERDGVFGKFIDRRAMAVQRNAIIRTRPIFREWSAVLSYEFDEDETQADVVRKWLESAGHHVGIMDSRPEFGKFTVDKMVAG